MARIDTAFDVRIDAGNGDPDTTSKTLREYHRLLWSKPLPSGEMFALDTSRRNRYLYHQSGLGEFLLSSDTVVPTWRSWTRIASIIDQVSEPELDSFQLANHTIGGILVFPGDKRPGVATINGARGFNARIADRLDLTIECIRRHYRGEVSPLGPTLAGYADFFALFQDFRGYINFFLLDDLVSPDYSRVEVFTNHTGFDDPALPRTVDEYRSYRHRAMSFIAARNERINSWANENLEQSGPS